MTINFTSVLKLSYQLPAPKAYSNPYTKSITTKFLLPGFAAMAFYFIKNIVTQNK